MLEEVEKLETFLNDESGYGFFDPDKLFTCAVGRETNEEIGVYINEIFIPMFQVQAGTIMLLEEKCRAAVAYFLHNMQDFCRAYAKQTSCYVSGDKLVLVLGNEKFSFRYEELKEVLIDEGSIDFVETGTAGKL